MAEGKRIKENIKEKVDFFISTNPSRDFKEWKKALKELSRVIS